MFRYIGLVWDFNDPAATSNAGLLDRGMPSARWQATLQRPGLRLWVADEGPGCNRAHCIEADRGVVLGTLFRRAELLDASAGATTLTLAEQRRVLDSTGQTLVDDFWGRYVAVIAAADGATHVLRDPSGTLPCFLIQHRSVWIVFSWLEDVLSTLPGVPLPEVSWDGIGAHLVSGVIDGHDTALAGITQVLPGEIAHLHRGVDTRRALWDPVGIAQRPSHAGFSETTSVLRDTVRGCVRAWASCYDGLVLRLSGGVDSSIVCGCLGGGSTSPRVTLLNYFRPATNGDERSFARLAAASIGRELIELEDDSAVRLERILEAALTPTPESYLGRIGTAGPDATTAAHNGAQALFTGAGGDAAFYEFRRWWPAADYLRLRGLDAGFMSSAMDAARLGKVSLWQTLRLAAMERMRSTAGREEPGRLLTLVRQTSLPGPDVHRRHSHPALWGRLDLPIGKLNQTQQLMLPLSYYDPFEREAAPEMVNPLLSQPLVELALAIPTFVLTQGGQGRSLARRAFAGILPAEIAARRSKGGMNDYAKHILASNLEFARALLLDGHLVKRGYLERAKVETALSDRPTTLGSPVSEIHMMIAIEAWLVRWISKPAPVRTR